VTLLDDAYDPFVRPVVAGSVARRHSAPPERSLAASPAANNESAWSPAGAAMMAKVVLFAGLGALAWLLYSHSGSETKPLEENDALNESDIREPGGFSAWEPEQ
jgi:hypothetical protein